jgi:hypothetical protein
MSKENINKVYGKHATNPETSTFAPKILKQLVLPILKTSVGEPIYVKFVEEITAKEKIEKDKDGKETKGEINIAHVVELQSGEEYHLVMGSVLLSTLVESYPEGGYVNKCFMVTKGEKRGSGAKSYHPYLLAEIEL